jgi:DNA-binding protein HU-beta
MALVKADLINLLMDRQQITRLQAVDRVDGFFDIVKGALAEEGRIEVRGFGVFEVRQRKPKRVTDIQSKQILEIPSRKVIKFKPGKDLKAIQNAS